MGGLLMVDYTGKEWMPVHRRHVHSFTMILIH
jgi:hypothetical protein